jgi:hypothetical protein
MKSQQKNACMNSNEENGETITSELPDLARFGSHAEKEPRSCSLPPFALLDAYAPT